jgi:hypothetical protein
VRVSRPKGETFGLRRWLEVLMADKLEMPPEDIRSHAAGAKVRRRLDEVVS